MGMINFKSYPVKIKTTFMVFLKQIKDENILIDSVDKLGSQ